MSGYSVCALYSGSGGNSVYIEAAGSKILIDAGKNAKTLCASLREIGSDICEIDAIFITHEHSDHVSALEVISKKHSIPIHIADDSAKKFDRDKNAFIHRNLVRHEREYRVSVGELRISSFRTPHDSLASVGYRIDFGEGEEAHSIGVATDIGYVTREISTSLEGCESVVLESNHDVDMLMEGRYPYDLKMRILSKGGHLSNKDSAALGAHLAQTGTRAILLAHLSEENNTPEIAYDEFVSAIGDFGVRIEVAAPDAPSYLCRDAKIKT